MYAHSSVIIIHCDIEGVLSDFHDVLLFKNGRTDTLYFLILGEKYDIAYYNKADIFTIHTQKKDTHFQLSQRCFYTQDCNPKKHKISMVHKFEGNAEGLTNRHVADTKRYW